MSDFSRFINEGKARVEEILKENEENKKKLESDNTFALFDIISESVFDSEQTNSDKK